jgi:hypothetical protein
LIRELGLHALQSVHMLPRQDPREKTYVSTIVNGVASGVASGGNIAGGITGATLSSKLFEMKQLMMELLPTPGSPSTTIRTVIAS